MPQLAGIRNHKTTPNGAKHRNITPLQADSSGLLIDIDLAQTDIQLLQPGL
jgi:hypothetical protein